MKYNELNVASHKKPTRKGRGIAAGQGKTAGRGTKGQNARAGGGVRPGFEGGQTPLMKRTPKLRGFRSIRPKAEVVYTGYLNDVGAKADNFKLAEAGLISNPYVRVKIVANGELSKKIAVATQGASKAAAEQIKKAGGTFEAVSVPQRKAAKAKQND